MKTRAGLSFLIIFFHVSTLFALEADQYAIWKGPPIKSARPLINERLNGLLNKHLENQVNKWIQLGHDLKTKPLPTPRPKYEEERLTSLANKRPNSCETIAFGFFRYIRPHFFKNRVKHWLFQNPQTQFYPAKKKLFGEIEHIYRGFAWPFVKMGSVALNVDGVYFGTDKIDHMFSSGRRYYKRYLKALRRGLSDDEARKKAIDFGVGYIEEKGWLGLWFSGAFSYADLEGNYRGMEMAIDMCSGKNPLLAQDGKGLWHAKRPLDFGQYMTPLWDEAYNNSYYAKRWKKRVQKVLKRTYCAEGLKPRARKLWASYDKRVKPAVHTTYLRDLIKRKKIPDPRPQSLHEVCGYKPGVMEGNPLWR